MEAGDSNDDDDDDDDAAVSFERVRSNTFEGPYSEEKQAAMDVLLSVARGR